MTNDREVENKRKFQYGFSELGCNIIEAAKNLKKAYLFFIIITTGYVKFLKPTVLIGKVGTDSCD